MGDIMKSHYPPPGKVKQFIQMAKDCGLDVCGFDVLPNGGFRILEARGVPPQAANDFDRWKDSL